MLMLIISLFSGNTPSFAILYFLWKEWCKCGVAMMVVYQNFSLLPWINQTIFWIFNWIEENYTVNIVSSATSISEGTFVGTLPFGHVCIILDDNSQTCLLDMFQLSNSEYKFCILDCTGVWLAASSRDLCISRTSWTWEWNSSPTGPYLQFCRTTEDKRIRLIT